MLKPTPREESAEAPHVLRRVRDVLLQKEGLDLDAYREPYVQRRLRARMNAAGVAVPEYLRRLADEPGERRRLIEELGVNVTAFWRDGAVWDMIESHELPGIVARQRATVRAASVGCATGEEAYSLAMMLAEACRERAIGFDVDAFDIDARALDEAITGRYATERLATVSDQARARYFEPDGGRWRVRAELRHHVRFRRLDTLREPLPGTYDLVMCRNLVIYLAAPAKEALILSLCAHVRPGGILVVGQTDTTGAPPAGFVALPRPLRGFARAPPRSPR